LEVELGGGEAPLALVGPNGSGKTTLLRIFCGAHTPSRGEIEVNGAVLFSSERGIDQPPEGRRVGYVPQGYGLFPHLKVIDNVAFGLLAKRPRSSATSRRNAAQRMLVELGCSQIAQRLPRQLSGGEQQRVALARALVIDPAILLMDEPLAALDAGARRRVRSFLAERLRALGRPSIVVTHDVRDVVALAADICVLEKGRVVQRGTLSELQKAPANDFVEEFVGMDPATPPGNANGSDVAPPPTTP
jgi:ABC-type sulfate/molybdate transport systems ATPase subunit